MRKSIYDQVPTGTNIKVRVNSDGILEGINPDGSIAWRQNANKSSWAMAARNDHRMSSRTFRVTMEDGTEVDLPYDPKIIKHHALIFPYVEEIAMEIVRRVAEGDTLKKICSTAGIPPYYIVAKWQIDVPGFKAMLAEARKIRAEMFHDEIVDVKDDVEEDTSKSAKVKLDALKHLAAVNDPDTFGSKTKITGDPNAPLNFVFNTGIARKDTPAIEENPAIPTEGGTVESDDTDS